MPPSNRCPDAPATARLNLRTCPCSTARFLIRDRDRKYPALFGILADTGIKVVLSGVRILRTNAIMERWVRSCRREGSPLRWTAWSVDPVSPRRFRHLGRKRADDRAALEDILYAVGTGIGWNWLPTAPYDLGLELRRKRPPGPPLRPAHGSMMGHPSGDTRPLISDVRQNGSAPRRDLIGLLLPANALWQHPVLPKPVQSSEEPGQVCVKLFPRHSI